MWEAWDEELKRTVALKRFTGPEGARVRGFRTELAALGTLRLPGVVELLGHADDGGVPLLVMQRVHGSPFPGLEGVVAWSWLATRLARLLAVLSSVHTYGFVHADIKPGNVLVGASGLVTLLDFGLARSRETRAEQPYAMSVHESGPYTAPELLEGGAPSARSDLFAVGVLAWAALKGRAPWGEGGGDPWRLLQAMRDAPAGAMEAGDVPVAAAELIGSLLAVAPADRPASAGEALDHLLRVQAGVDLDLPPLPMIQAEGRLTEEELRLLFHGPSALLHLPQDAAAVLLSQTGGEPAEVEAELKRWCLTGLATPEAGRLRVERTAIRRLKAGERRRLGVPVNRRQAICLPAVDEEVLVWIALAWPFTSAAWLARLAVLPLGQLRTILDRLVAGGWIALDLEGRAQDRTGGAALSVWDPLRRASAHAALADLLRPGESTRLRHLLAADRLAEAQREASTLAERAGRAGDLATGLALLEDAIQWALAEGDVAEALRLLEQAVPMAIASEEREPLLPLWALRKDARIAEAASSLLALVEAAILSLDGDAVGARAALDSLDVPLPESLELRRQAVVVRVARLGAVDAHERLLGEIEAEWAPRSAERQARTRGWWGQLRYRQGRYSEASALHLAAAKAKAGVDAQISSLLNAASAHLEADRWTRAREIAARAEAQAQVLRLTQYEARATWILRAAAYRSGDLAPEPELIEAALLLGEPRTSALILLTEAAAAWRQGDMTLAVRAAEAARERFDGVGFHDGATLAASLSCAASHMADVRQREDLLDRVSRCKLPLIQLQALGLVRPSGPDRVPCHALAATLARSLPRSRWLNRREVLSVAEALHALGVSSSTTFSHEGPLAPEGDEPS